MLCAKPAPRSLAAHALLLYFSLGLRSLRDHNLPIAHALARGDLQGGTLTIDSKAWRIDGHTLRPNPDGELKGEICIFLMDGDA